MADFDALTDRLADRPVDGLGSRAALDYALRTSQQNTLNLSAMADQKASVVLGASLVMASIVFGDISVRDDLSATLIVLAATAVATGMVSAMVLVPRLRAGGDRGVGSLFFFTQAARLSRQEYGERMRELLQSEPDMYEAMFDDLHAASVLVAQKYRVLKVAYGVLVVGLVATFVVAVAT